MNILVTLNDNYVRPLLVMLDSLFDHEKTPIDVYLLYSDISEENRQKIAGFIEGRGNRFFPIFVEGNVFAGAPILDYFTGEMYYRLLCSRLLPATLDRVLYLDPDIMIRSSVLPLYEADFQGSLLVGVSDYGVNHFLPHKKEVLGFTRDEVYINSGVLLFNLEKMREEFSLRDFLGLLEEYKDVVSYPDQDIINLYFKGKILFADKIYNYNPGYHTPDKLIAYVFLRKRPAAEPVIVHYMGPIKPWYVEYYLKYYFEYFHYLRPRLTRKERVVFFFKPVIVFGKLVSQMLRFIFRTLGDMIRGGPKED